MGLSVPPVKLTHRTVTLALREPFSISRSTEETVDSVFVEIDHDGLVGYGEASPQEHYGESVESASAFLAEAESLLGDDPFALDEVEERLASLPGEHAAKAAVDMALHDLCGKIAGVPVWRLLGLRREGPPTSWTIWLGDPDDMARRTERVGEPLPPPEAQARRGGRARRRARASGARRHRASAPGGRERGLGARRGARERRGALRVSASSTSNSRCRRAIRKGTG